MKYVKYLSLIIAASFLIWIISFTPVNKLEDYYSLIFTFQSIIIGFVITSLSIIVSSPFSKKLYDIQSEKNNSETLLHEFLHTIIRILIVFIIPLVLILLIKLLTYFDLPCIVIEIYNSTIFVTTIISLILFIMLIIKIKFFVLQSAIEEKKI